MTIAIGLLCNDGVVVGADREVTLSTFKVQDQKAHLLKRNNVSLGLVGSGSLDLITKASQELDKRLSHEMSHEAVKDAVETLAQEFHEKYVLGNPEARHVLDLLIGVKTTPTRGARQVGLLKVSGNLVVWKDRYDVFGYASELGQYLLSGLYGEREKLSVARGVMLAAQVLNAVKRFGKYSGGESDIIQVRLGWVANFVNEDDIHLHEDSADKFAKIIKPVMLAMSDINVGPKLLEDLIGKMTNELHAFRSNDFNNRQRQLFAQSPSESRGYVSINAQDHTSVFEVVESSGPTMQSDYGTFKDDDNK